MRPSLALLLLFCALGCVIPSQAQSCSVTDVRRGDFYDLSGLTRKTGGANWQVTSGHYTYLLNICDVLLAQSIPVSGIQKTCGTDTSGCQIDTMYADQSAKKLGGNATIVVKDSGELEVKLTGGDHCKRADVDRSVSILLHCNEGAGLGSPRFVEEDDACLYIFEWETAFACPVQTATPTPVIVKDCMVVDKDAQLRYDLTPLTLSKANWFVADGEYEYFINVCNEVHNIPACSNHSACQTKPTDSTFIKQLGLSSGRPIIENGVLKLVLTGGKSCHGGANQRQTTIIFTCKAGESLGKPRFLEETDSCMYIFAWESSAACGEPLTTTCSVKDASSDKYVDLSPLIKEEGQKNHVASSAVPGDTSTYKLNICNGLTSNDNPCRSGTSICELEAGQSVGRSLGNVGTLVVSEGDVVMKYSDGDLCPETDERVSTDIYFICDPSAKDSHPKLFSSKNKCQYLFNWKTKYACEVSAPGETSGKKLSGGAIFAIVFFTFVFAYLIGGVAYNRFVRGEKGLDQIPHYSFFQAIYYTIREQFAGRSTGAIQI